MTRHIDVRMNQRGIGRRLVDLTVDLGRVEGDRYILDRQAIDKRMRTIEEENRRLNENLNQCMEELSRLTGQSRSGPVSRRVNEQALVIGG